ncbi:nucleotidyltransferase family protein [bacterium]|nr:nucleotidyltransferase family protein [bacterium]
MKKLEEIRRVLKSQKRNLKRRFGVLELALFGSYTRGEERKASDLDILVSLKPEYKTFDNYMKLKFYLEDLVGISVDLVTKDAFREELREAVLEAALYV